MVSPGATSVASTFRRLAAPCVPSAMTTVPAVTLCESLTVLVKVPKAPALAAAAATIANTTKAPMLPRAVPSLRVDERSA